MPTQTIGERDIEFYEMCIENHRTAKRRCVPSSEHAHELRAQAAQKVVDALVAYSLTLQLATGETTS